MLSWWLSLDSAHKILYEWLLGIVASTIYIMVYTLRRYYVEYTKFLKGHSHEEPHAFIAHSGRELDGEQTAMLLLVFLFSIAGWPVTLAIVFALKVRKLSFFTKLLNPMFWTRQWALKRNKTLVVTSPDKRIRALVGRKSKNEQP